MKVKVKKDTKYQWVYRGVNEPPHTVTAGTPTTLIDEYEEVGNMHPPRLSEFNEYERDLVLKALGKGWRVFTNYEYLIAIHPKDVAQ